MIERKTPLYSTTLCVFRCIIKGFKPEVCCYLMSEKINIFKNYVLLEGAISHNYQQLSVSLYQLSSHTNNFVE